MVWQGFLNGQNLTTRVRFLQNKLLLIGSGKWPNKITSIIRSQNSEALIKKVGAREFLELRLEHFQPLLKDKVVWIASTPENQLLILEKIKCFSNRVILEKPFSISLNQLNQLRELNKNGNNKFYVSEPWRHSELWREAKSRILKVSGLKKLQIYRGDSVRRVYAEPPWDWMQHDLGLLSELLVMQKEQLRINCEMSKTKDNLIIYIQAPERYEIEINLGLFPQRKELWILNDQLFVDFANREMFNDHPVNSMFEYVRSKDFSSDFENQTWLTNEIINQLDEVKLV
jgi:hypothetical protein